MVRSAAGRHIRCCERKVYERPLAGGGARRLRESLQVGEAERQRAARERAHRARRQVRRSGQRSAGCATAARLELCLEPCPEPCLYRHESTIQRGCDRNGHGLGADRFRPMLVDTGVMAPSLAEVGQRAKALEDIGYDGVLTAETAHDPFLPLAIAAEHTERIELSTGIAVAFARTPMITAIHRERPATRRRGAASSSASVRRSSRTSEALQHAVGRAGGADARAACWRCARSGRTGTTARSSSSVGKFYNHTLMTPFFTPDRTRSTARRRCFWPRSGRR